MPKREPYRSWFYRYFWAFILLAFIFVIYRVLNSPLPIPEDASRERDRTSSNYLEAVVLKVIDGDTLLVLVNGRKERVRLIGIDTPESSFNRKARRDVQRFKVAPEDMIEAGRRAKEFVKTLLKPGTKVKLELDVQVRDKYGRLLAYVYLPDGRMLNLLLVERGLARVYTFPPNVKYTEKFLQAQEKARERGIGFWGEIFK